MINNRQLEGTTHNHEIITGQAGEKVGAEENEHNETARKEVNQTIDRGNQSLRINENELGIAIERPNKTKAKFVNNPMEGTLATNSYCPPCPICSTENAKRYERQAEETNEASITIKSDTCNAKRDRIVIILAFLIIFYLILA